MGDRDFIYGDELVVADKVAATGFKLPTGMQLYAMRLMGRTRDEVPHDQTWAFTLESLGLVIRAVMSAVANEGEAMQFAMILAPLFNIDPDEARRHFERNRDEFNARAERDRGTQGYL